MEASNEHETYIYLLNMPIKEGIILTRYSVYDLKNSGRFFLDTHLAIKKSMDVLISICVLITLLPLFLIISTLVKLSSPGPIIYKQQRVGLMGHPFTIYKFRTMVNNADELLKKIKHKNEVNGPVFKIKNDPRITKVGKILRQTGLDELPQVFNVLKGDMSLVGPRPALKEEVLKYKDWYLKRLSVKPGITCLWQIKPNRNDIKFEEWMKLDIKYINEWSPSLDTVILFKTIRTIFERSGL